MTNAIRRRRRRLLLSSSSAQLSFRLTVQRPAAAGEDASPRPRPRAPSLAPSAPRGSGTGPPRARFASAHGRAAASSNGALPAPDLSILPLPRRPLLIRRRERRAEPFVPADSLFPRTAGLLAVGALSGVLNIPAGHPTISLAGLLSVPRLMKTSPRTLPPPPAREPSQGAQPGSANEEKSGMRSRPEHRYIRIDEMKMSRWWWGDGLPRPRRPPSSNLTTNPVASLSSRCHRPRSISAPPCWFPSPAPLPYAAAPPPSSSRRTRPPPSPNRRPTTSPHPGTLSIHPSPLKGRDSS